jgi:predicted nucleic acid-binding protein
VKWLVDTNAISETLQLRPDPHVVGWFRITQSNDIAMSIVTLAELRDGASTAREEARRRRLFAWIDATVTPAFENRILPLSLEILIDWLRLGRLLRSQGAPHDPSDLLIASTARVHNLIVVSRNLRHFVGTGVTLYNPWDAQTHYLDTR